MTKHGRGRVYRQRGGDLPVRHRGRRRLCKTCRCKYNPGDDLSRHLEFANAEVEATNNPLTDAIGSLMIINDTPPGTPLPLSGGAMSLGLGFAVSPRGSGYFNVNPNHVRMHRYLDWSSVSPFVAHSFLSPSAGMPVDIPALFDHPTSGIPAYPDITWSRDVPGSPPCIKNGGSYWHTLHSRVTDYGAGPGAQITVAYDNVPKYRTEFLFDTRKCIEANDIDSNPRKIWVYYNSAVGENVADILSVPASAWQHSTGLDIWSVSNGSVGDYEYVTTTANPYPGGGIPDYGSIMDRPNPLYGIVGESPFTTNNLRLSYHIVELVQAAAQTRVEDGHVTLNSLIRYVLATSCDYGRLVGSTNLYTWTPGAAIYPPNSQPPTLGIPTHSYYDPNYSAGSIHTRIDLATELPQFTNSVDTQGAYVFLAWAPSETVVGTTEAVSPAITDRDARSAYSEGVQGQFPLTHYLGTETVKLEMLSNSSSWLMPTSFQIGSFSTAFESAGYASDPDPSRGQWKSVGSFTWPMIKDPATLSDIKPGRGFTFNSTLGFYVMNQSSSGTSYTLDSTALSSGTEFTRNETPDP